MHPFDAILKCLCLDRSAHYDVLEEQPAPGFPHEKTQYPQTPQPIALGFSHEKKQHLQTQSLAEDVLSTLYAADINDGHLFQRLQDIVRETGWYESLAASVLNGLENALKNGDHMGQEMKVAYDKATQVVGDIWGFVKGHPVFFALVALGILVILVPWAIEILGFGELGPIEGTFAAWWQSTYRGYVPAKSLFSFFQRLGMVWGRKLATFS